MTVKVVDKGWNAMVDRLSQDAYSKVGYPTNTVSHGEGLSVVDVAAFHEFGTKDIPIRAHVRSTYDEKIEDLSKMSAAELGKVVDGRQTVKMAMARLGEFHAGQIKTKINEGPFKELSPKTIAAKGSDRPLIDTGQMIQSVDHVEGFGNGTL
jgi:hypothetical protein